MVTLAACDRRDGTVAQQSALQLTDIKGRTVSVPGPVSKIAIDDSRYLVALSLIHPDPVSLLSAWAHDDNRLGAEGYAQFLKASPELADLPRIASSAENFDVESIIAARPDVAVLSVESGVTDAQIERVEGAGIPVVVLDFFADPLDDLAPSLEILGKLVGREEQAREFLAFRKQRMDAIARRVAELPEAERTLVFLEAHAGSSPDCCNSPGRGNASDYLQFVGGHNIGADALSQSSGKLNLEYVISRDPAVYIATGGPHLAARGGFVVGPGYSEQDARESLRKVAARRGIADLTAVREGRIYGFSHQLLNSPLDIVAIETFAKWLHPQVFADLAPDQTLATLNSRFLAVPYDGAYWVSLKE
ncbi:ABC transporter substrate-binding protein [Pelagerythrobacter sp.]|uniref:ABC transporter substrate-binding protein n=1 Tax=Pelagerythrobacter sp. TaxID=2800702 RepID=UPI0035AFB45F